MNKGEMIELRDVCGNVRKYPPFPMYLFGALQENIVSYECKYKIGSSNIVTLSCARESMTYLISIKRINCMGLINVDYKILNEININFELKFEKELSTYECMNTVEDYIKICMIPNAVESLKISKYLFFDRDLKKFKALNCDMLPDTFGTYNSISFKQIADNNNLDEMDLQKVYNLVIQDKLNLSLDNILDFKLYQCSTNVYIYCYKVIKRRLSSTIAGFVILKSKDEVPIVINIKELFFEWGDNYDNFSEIITDVVGEYNKFVDGLKDFFDVI